MLDDDEIKEANEELARAMAAILRHIDKAFGGLRGIPKGHDLLEALEAIEVVRVILDVAEDTEDEDGHGD
jgi:hypothetical protein